MLKKRIIPIQLLLNDRLVKTKKFNSPKDVGDPVKSSKIYSDQDADELLLLNINENKNIDQTIKHLDKIAEVCFVPLAVGGGVSSISDAEKLISSGADKIVMNSLFFDNRSEIKKIIERYGSQSVILSIDVDFINERYIIVRSNGKVKTDIELTDILDDVKHLKIGEIMIQNISFDGTMKGADLTLLQILNNYLDIPIIYASGVGNFNHILDAFNNGASAVACGSIFNFSDSNPLRAKAFLKNYQIPLKKI